MLTIDDREVTEHPELRTGLSMPVKVERLDSADYAFMDRAREPEGIERCEVGNLMQKIRNRELEEQLARCDQAYSKVILLAEGVYDHLGGLLVHYRKSREGNSFYRSRVEPHFTYKEVKACLIRLSELGIEVLESPSFECSMRLIETIYEQRTKPEEAHSMFKKLRNIAIPVKLSSNPAVPRLLALVPRLPEKVAVRMILQYETIWNILNAPEADLLAIDGFGKKGLENLKKGIGLL